MIEIIVNDELKIPDPTGELTPLAESALRIASPELVCDMSVAITTDEEIHQLNLQYRKIDRPTDVLSFESDEQDPESGIRYLGDIAISYPRAQQQAENAGHSTLNELSLLLVHGILHLLGYNHDSPERKSMMWQLQDQILALNGVHLNKISGDQDDE